MYESYEPIQARFPGRRSCRSNSRCKRLSVHEARRGERLGDVSANADEGVTRENVAEGGAGRVAGRERAIRRRPLPGAESSGESPRQRFWPVSVRRNPELPRLTAAD